MTETIDEAVEREVPPAPMDRAGLRAWVRENCGLVLPETGVCPGHDSPLDYLAHTFFEGGSADCVVWACRGGGKTQIGAVATLLDLLYKPGVQVRILAGSVEQAGKMFGYLRGMVEGRFAGEVEGKVGRRSVALMNGSRAEVLAQSETSVRGTHVTKLRCDEVELFSPEIWSAAQLVTKKHRRLPRGRGSVEAFSTLHVPGGLMSRVVDAARGRGARVFTWCVWDVIERCPPAARACDGCALWDGCAGRARDAAGFMAVEDVLAMRGRVSATVWRNEVLCLPPAHDDAVFPGFDATVHVRPAAAAAAAFGPGWRTALGVDFGYAGAYAAVFVRVWGRGDAARVHVTGEYVKSRAGLSENVAAVAALAAAEWPAAAHVDPAGQAINSHSMVSDVRVMRDAGFHVTYRRRGVYDGLEVIRRLLRPAAGEPRLTIDPGCRKLIAAMENYRWDAARAGKVYKDNVHDHLMDALRYALCGELLPETKTEFAAYAS